MSSRKEFRDLAPPEEAHGAIRSLDLTSGTETVPLRAARGRVLANRLDAAIDVPGFDRASVDGYAVRAEDTFGADEVDPVVLDHAGVVHAGEQPDASVEPGVCVEVSTGAVMPPGADAVVMVERTSEREGAVAVRTAVAPGDRVMVAGADIAAGERALGPGTEITPREVGLLSALGLDEVEVRGRPTVGVISTGDELVRPGEPLDHDAGQIHDVNSYTVAAGIEEAGGEAVIYPHAGDDYDAMEHILTEAAEECDLVLSSGSTSASAVDVIYRVVEEQGELLLHGVAVKPGKPMLVGRLADSAYVGLPGYPVSALTIFRTFVAPAIRRAAGRPEPKTATVSGRMAARERYPEGRLRLMPVGLVEAGDDERLDGKDVSGETLVYPVDKGSGATTSLVEADGIVEMHPDVEYLAPGERVEVELFSPEGRVPALFGAGEDDPALSRLLDRVERPRYLSLGSREGLRRLREGVPDVAVTTGGAPDFEAEHLGAWRREWGLVVPEGNPDDVEGLADLVDRELRFVNRATASGLRTSLGEAVAALAEKRDSSRHDVVAAIDGFDFAVRATESPARRVLVGDADAGLGLRATADRLGAGFVPLGMETVSVFSNPDRIGKPGVRALTAAIEAGEDVFDSLPGYDAG